MKMYVVVPHYQADEFLSACVESIERQEVPSDVSVELLVSEDGRDGVRVGATRNIWDTVLRSGAQADDVVVLVDGDDRLLPGGLARIAKEYRDPDVWLTYGSYVTEPHSDTAHPAEPYPEEVVLRRSFRRDLARFNHPITFRYFLFDFLEPEDVMVEGEWVFCMYDQAYMYPMLELAEAHHRWIPDVLYVYNEANPLSVGKSDNERASREGLILRSKDSMPVVHYLDGYLTMHPAYKAQAVISTMYETGAEWLVETGTSHGTTCSAVAEEFPKRRVLTVEADRATYRRATKQLFRHGNLTIVHGNSGEILPELADQVSNAVWWLDAHWVDSDMSVPDDQVTPVVAEVRAVLERDRGETMMIDDARLFGRVRGYPTLSELRDLVGTAYDLRVVRDIIYLTPRGSPCGSS